MKQYTVTYYDIAKFYDDKKTQHWLYIQCFWHLFFFKLFLALFATIGVHVMISDTLKEFSYAHFIFALIFILSIDLIFFIIIFAFIQFCYAFGARASRGYLVNHTVKKGDSICVNGNLVTVNDETYTIKKQYKSDSYYVYVLKFGLVAFIPINTNK